MPGPVFFLRIWGMICPCLEKDEDSNARASLKQLNTLGLEVEWHQCSNNNGQGAARQVASGIASFFRSSTTNTQHHTDNEAPIPAQFRLVDATNDSINHGDPYPELQLKPLKRKQYFGNGNDEGDHDTHDDPSSKQKGGGLGGLLSRRTNEYQLDIPLHHVLRIETIDPTMVVIITKDVHSTDENASSKEAARISFRNSGEMHKAEIDLRVLVEWNKHRQPDIEEDIPADGIRTRAKKAAHFARREMEMRETKRSREQRKAKLMEGGAGLKYTAMAMAQQIAD